MTEMKRMAGLWARLGATYGTRWGQQFGGGGDKQKMAMEVWGEGLRDIPDEAMARALKRCADRHLEWPPTLPEFRELCLASRTFDELPRRPLDPERGIEHTPTSTRDGPGYREFVRTAKQMGGPLGRWALRHFAPEEKA